MWFENNYIAGTIKKVESMAMAKKFMAYSKNPVIRFIQKLMTFVKRHFRVMIIAFGCFFFVLIIPFLISSLYLYGTQNHIKQITVYSANDVLQYYAVVLVGIITTLTAFLTLRKNNKNFIQQMKIQICQENRPYFVIDHLHLDNNQNLIKNEDNVTKEFWSGDFSISELEREKKKECHTNLIITIKNLGNGFAISPTIEILQQKGDELYYKINDGKVVNKGECFDAQIDITKFWDFDSISYREEPPFPKNLGSMLNWSFFWIKIYYFNLSGADFMQKIFLESHVQKDNSIKFNVYNISKQSVDFDL